MRSYPIAERPEMILPHIARTVIALHKIDMFVELHFCDKIDKLLRNSVATGIDV